MASVLLCVNIDHIATVREARGGNQPDPVSAVHICEKNGADGITAHLREDRRHMQDADIFRLKKIVKGKFNLEMALARDIIEIARQVVPDQVTLVPEKRRELTTEGGLDVQKNERKIRQLINDFHDRGILVSLFIEPAIDTVERSKDVGADFIEIHTGSYAAAKSSAAIQKELKKIMAAAKLAQQIGLRINAGHGLDYSNIKSILQLPGLEEVNIGHSIIARSITTGIGSAVAEMKKIITVK